MVCQFLLYSKVNQLYVYIYPLFVGFPSHLGQHRALNRVPCAIKQGLTSYLFYTQQCIHVNPNLPIHPTPPYPPWCPYVCSLHLCPYFCFANRFICTIFLDSTYMLMSCLEPDLHIWGPDSHLVPASLFPPSCYVFQQLNGVLLQQNNADDDGQVQQE